MTDASLLCVGNLTVDDLVVDGTTTTALGGDALFAALAAAACWTTCACWHRWGPTCRPRSSRPSPEPVSRSRRPARGPSPPSGTA